MLLVVSIVAARSREEAILEEAFAGISRVAEVITCLPAKDSLRAFDAAERSYRKTAQDLGYAESQAPRIAPLAAEIIASDVDVTFAIGPAVVRAFRAATQTVPIVANDLESDPVDSGIAKSLAHPGGNVTGVFFAFPEFSAKWLELLKQTIPQLSRVAVLWDPTTGSMQKKRHCGRSRSAQGDAGDCRGSDAVRF